MRLFQLIMQLLQVPDINDKDALQAWLLDLLAVLEVLAMRSGITADDKLVRLASGLIAANETWDNLYGLITMFLNDDEDDDENKVAAAIDNSSKLAAFDPLTILAIIKAIAEIINMFRQQS